MLLEEGQQLEFDTPRYELSTNRLIENYHFMKECLKECKIFYALKSCADKHALHKLAGISDGFEAASEPEAYRLLELGVSPAKILYGLPIKSEQSIKNLYNRGIGYFVFDDQQEYKKIKRQAPDAKRILRLYISDIATDSIPYGMLFEDILAWHTISGILHEIQGISFHISNNKYIEPMIAVLERVESLLCKRKENENFIVNIGGSFEQDAPQDYYELLNQKLHSLKQTYGVVVYAEPGKSIINSAFRF